MKRWKYVFAVLATLCSLPSFAGAKSLPVEWESVSDLANTAEIDAVQEELNKYSCSGYPLKQKIYSNQTFDMDEVRSIVKICRNAKVARISNLGPNQLLILQYDGEGSCGDFWDAFFIENNVGDRVERVNGHHTKSICGGGLIPPRQINDGDLFTVAGGIEETDKDGNRIRPDLKLFWDGTNIIDRSNSSQ